MRRSTMLLVLLFLPAFGHATEPLSFGPFQGVDTSILSPSQREVITQASEDFDRVLRGRKPKHAVFDDKAPLPADGGTQSFVGNQYRLTVVKSLSSFGDAEGWLHGYIYGPVVKFSESFAPGNMSEVMSLRFYSREQLNVLMSNK